MNRHARRAMESGKGRQKMAVVEKAVEALSSVKSLDQMVDHVKDAREALADLKQISDALIADHEELSHENEALKRTVFRLLGDIAKDVFAEELHHLKKVGE